jgi:hypothetical protein
MLPKPLYSDGYSGPPKETGPRCRGIAGLTQFNSHLRMAFAGYCSRQGELTITLKRSKIVQKYYVTAETLRTQRFLSFLLSAERAKSKITSPSGNLSSELVKIS